MPDARASGRWTEAPRRRPSSPCKFTRSELSMTYLPGVACPPFSVVAVLAGKRTGRRDAEAAGGSRHRPSRGAAPLMAPRWFRVLSPSGWVLAAWSALFPVGYDLTGALASSPEPRVRVRGESKAAGSGGGAASRASVAPPPFFPVESVTAASTELREHSQRPNGSPPVSRKRVVLLPHPPIEPINARLITAAAEGPRA